MSTEQGQRAIPLLVSVADAPHVGRLTITQNGGDHEVEGALISLPAAAVTGANPTGSIGATAVNGSNATFMRSDAAPKFDIANLTAKTTPVDADVLAIADSEAANALKGLTVANLKAVMKTYFDTLYAAK